MHDCRYGWNILILHCNMLLASGWSNEVGVIMVLNVFRHTLCFYWNTNVILPDTGQDDVNDDPVHTTSERTCHDDS